MPKAELSDVLSRPVVFREPVGQHGAVCSVDVSGLYSALCAVDASNMHAALPGMSWLLTARGEELWASMEPLVDLAELQSGDMVSIHAVEWDRSKPRQAPISQYVTIIRQPDGKLCGAFCPTAFNGPAPDVVIDDFHIEQMRTSYNGRGTICEDAARVVFGAFLCLDLCWPDLDPDRVQSICIGPVVGATLFPGNGIANDSRATL